MPMTLQEILEFDAPAPDETIRYGDEPSQYVEAYLPRRTGTMTAIHLIHGGCWRAEYDLEHVRPLAHRLRGEGFLVWSMEYRRLGESSGGFPGTFEDIARAATRLDEVAVGKGWRIGSRLAVGHSAGGQLALWLGAQAGRTGALAPEAPRLNGAVSLAGVNDLERASQESVCEDSPARLLGNDVGPRESQLSPFALLPLGIPQSLVHGDADDIVPVDYSLSYADKAARAGERVDITVIEGAGHFEPIAPSGEATEALVSSLERLASV